MPTLVVGMLVELFNTSTFEDCKRPSLKQHQVQLQNPRNRNFRGIPIPQIRDWHQNPIMCYN
jgi:hypothetical protein